MRNPRSVGTGVGLVLFGVGGQLIRNGTLGWDRGGYSYDLLIMGAGIGLVLVAYGWWPERLAPRAALAILGAVAFLYGLSCVAGGWLGTAPWQYRDVDRVLWLSEHPDQISPWMFQEGGTRIVVRDESRWILLSGLLVAYGIALVGLSLWPRYRRGVEG